MKERTHFSKSLTSILPNRRAPTNKSDGRAWEIGVWSVDRRPLPSTGYRSTACPPPPSQFSLDVPAQLACAGTRTLLFVRQLDLASVP